MKNSTKIFTILIGFTFLAFLIGLSEISSVWFVAILLLSTLVKGKLIIDHFMGLKEYEKRWCNFPTLWLFFLLIVIAGFYFKSLYI